MKYKRWKRLMAVLLAVIAAIQINLSDRIVYGAYLLQKQSISKKIFYYVDKETYLLEEGKAGKVYYTREDEEYVSLVSGMIDIYYPLIAQDFNLSGTKKVSAVIYPDRKSLCDVLGMEEKDAPMGAYYGGIINILSPSAWAGAGDSKTIDAFLEDGPVVHELVHLAVDEKCRGNYDLWFTEGMALYYEKKYTGFEWRPDLKQKSAAITLSDLEERFSGQNEILAYRKSYDIISAIGIKYGEDAIQKIAESMQRGKSFRESLRAIQ